MRRINSFPISIRKVASNFGVDVEQGLRKLFDRLNNFGFVVIGDSVMWGQGLREEQKIHSLLKSFIQNKLSGIQIDLKVFAHSGAVIGTEEQRSDTTNPIHGEVPTDCPTILRQIDLSSHDVDKDVDLVLVNGGMNDLNFKTIVDPTGPDLDHLCNDFCHNRVKTLLIEINKKFPIAKIILLGYYKILSSDSNLLNVYLLLIFANILILPVDLLGTAVTIATGGIINIGGAEVMVAEGVLSVTVLETIKRRCELFFLFSEQCFSSAVKEINLLINNKAIFVSSGWNVENSVFASNPFLFGINKDLSPQDDDVISGDRAKACESFGRDDLQCKVASTGHPNAKGAAKYAQQICNVLF